MNWAVVMTGGRGTRFWPESRARRPKPFLKLLGDRTFLEETVLRLRPQFSWDRIVIVIQDSLVKEAKRLFPRIPHENFLGEPIGRNTAPCCVFAASRIARQDGEAKIVFLPSDQYIQPKPIFRKTLKTAFQIVDEKPVLLGIRPDSPHTGYGYVEVSRSRKKINGISYFKVKRFREKPGPVEARRFLRQGNFFWNGGTFVWQLEAFKQAVKSHAPKIYSAWDRLGSLNVGMYCNMPLLLRIYRTLPSISIDYALMEKMKNVHCLLAPFKLIDLGGWEGLAEFWPADERRNRIIGHKGAIDRALAIFVDSRRNIIKTSGRLIALVGAEDLVVIDTEDALLISHRKNAESVRNVVRELEKRKAFHYL